MSVKCKYCDAELPEEAKFCLSCGQSVELVVPEPAAPPSGSSTDTRAFFYLAFGIFAFMIGFMMAFPVLLVGGLHLWPIVTIPFAAGILLFWARHRMLHGYAEKVEKLREEAAAKVKCSYCGTLNAHNAKKCESCGAAL